MTRRMSSVQTVVCVPHNRFYTSARACFLNSYFPALYSSFLVLYSYCLLSPSLGRVGEGLPLAYFSLNPFFCKPSLMASTCSWLRVSRRTRSSQEFTLWLAMPRS